jgi:hypothetical protein
MARDAHYAIECQAKHSAALTPDKPDDGQGVGACMVDRYRNLYADATKVKGLTIELLDAWRDAIWRSLAEKDKDYSLYNYRSMPAKLTMALAEFKKLEAFVKPFMQSKQLLLCKRCVDLGGRCTTILATRMLTTT